MPIYKGSTKLGTICHGGTKIGKGYKGSTLVFQDKIEETLKQSNYYGGSTFPSTSVGSYWFGWFWNGTLKGINGVIGNTGSSVSVHFFHADNVQETQTIPFNREVNISGYKYYEYHTGVYYAYVSPKQIVNDGIVTIYNEPLDKYKITSISGNTLTVNNSVTKDLIVSFGETNIIYRA